MQLEGGEDNENEKTKIQNFSVCCSGNIGPEPISNAKRICNSHMSRENVAQRQIFRFKNLQTRRELNEGAKQSRGLGTKDETRDARGS